MKKSKISNKEKVDKNILFKVVMVLINSLGVSSSSCEIQNIYFYFTLFGFTAICIIVEQMIVSLLKLDNIKSIFKEHYSKYILLTLLYTLIFLIPWTTYCKIYFAFILYCSAISYAFYITDN